MLPAVAYPGIFMNAFLKKTPRSLRRSEGRKKRSLEQGLPGQINTRGDRFGNQVDAKGGIHTLLDGTGQGHHVV